MRTALVTGSTGFIGRHVVHELLACGWRVFATGRKRRRDAGFHEGVNYFPMALPNEEIGYWLGSNQIELCIHCAGRSSVGSSMQNPYLDFEDSVVVTASLLEQLRENRSKALFIFLSSAAVYGQPVRLPVNEHDPRNPISVYGYHKLVCELLVEKAFKLHGIRTCIARVFSAYGAGLRKQILWDICTQIHLTNRVQLSGTGKETRDFIHVMDVARALALLADRARGEGEVYNIANGEAVTIERLTKNLLLHFPSVNALSFGGEKRVGDPDFWVADIERIRGIGFEPQIGLDEGLSSMAAWFCALEANTTGDVMQ